MAEKPTYEELEKRVQELERGKSMPNEAKITLAETEHLFKSVMEQSPLAIEIYDPNGQLLIVNDTWESFWDMKKSDMVNFNILNDPECERTGLTSAFKNALQDIPCSIPPSKYDPEASGFPHGSIRWISSKIYPVKDVDGKTKNIVLIMEDITALKKTENALLKAHDELELKVKDRTKELYRELQERKQTEKALKNNQNFLNRIIDQSPFATWISDEKGTIIKCNTALEKLLNITGEQLIGKYNVFNDEVAIEQGLIPKIRTVFEDGKTANFSVEWDANELGYKDANKVHIEGTMFPIHDDKGELTNVVNHWIDATKRKMAEIALKESREKYRSIMESMTEAAYICSSDFLIEYMNPAMIKRTGYNAIGELCHKIMYNSDEKCSWCVSEKVMNGESINYELASPKDDRTYHISNSPIFHSDGAISKFTVFRDVTEIKKIEEQLHQAQKMESIGTLAGGIAHDFNNILFPIVGHTEMLLEDTPDNSSYREGLNEIYAGAIRAKELVKQILTFSRQESAEFKLLKMQPIIKEASKLIRHTIPTTIEIKQDIQDDCGPIKADPTQIHQIIMNLATNAYHAMEETGGELNIRLKEVEFGEPDLFNPDIKLPKYARLSIADTGKGMGKDTIKKIFDPFFTTKEAGKGTGMGLSVVHGIVKSMNGTIKVDSRTDKGTEFRIYIPLIENFAEKKELQTKQPIQIGTERILLVDDEESIMTMEKRMLERLGYHVIARTSSIEALKAFHASSDKFDIIITDMQMPNMSGDKLANEITKIRPDIPVLLCTGFSETMSAEKAESLGINGFLLKPISMKDLSFKIREVLDKK